MNIILNNSKNATKYLMKRYGKIYKYSFEQQIYFEEVISEDHTQQELEFILEELSYSMTLDRDLSSLRNIPFTMLIATFTVISTLVIATTTMMYNVLIQGLGYAMENELSLNNFFSGSEDVMSFSINFIMFSYILISSGIVVGIRVMTKAQGKVHFFHKLINNSLRKKNKINY